MSKPGQTKCSWDQKQTDNPVEPNYDDRGKSNRNCDQVQSAVHRMVVRAVVMRIEAHESPRFRARIIARKPQAALRIARSIAPEALLHGRAAEIIKQGRDYL